MPLPKRFTRIDLDGIDTRVEAGDILDAAEVKLLTGYIRRLKGEEAPKYYDPVVQRTLVGQGILFVDQPKMRE